MGVTGGPNSVAMETIIQLSKATPSELQKLVEPTKFDSVACNQGFCYGSIQYHCGVYNLEIMVQSTAGRTYLMRSFQDPAVIYDQLVNIICDHAAGTLYEQQRCGGWKLWNSLAVFRSF